MPALDLTTPRPANPVVRAASAIAGLAVRAVPGQRAILAKRIRPAMRTEPGLTAEQFAYFTERHRAGGAA